MSDDFLLLDVFSKNRKNSLTPPQVFPYPPHLLTAQPTESNGQQHPPSIYRVCQTLLTTHTPRLYVSNYQTLLQLNQKCSEVGGWGWRLLGFQKSDTRSKLQQLTNLCFVSLSGWEDSDGEMVYTWNHCRVWILRTTFAAKSRFN